MVSRILFERGYVNVPVGPEKQLATAKTYLAHGIFFKMLAKKTKKLIEKLVSSFCINPNLAKLSKQNLLSLEISPYRGPMQ